MKKEINCTTDLCVNLKTILRSDKRARSGKNYLGILHRDEASEEFNFDEHYTFIEVLPTQSVPVVPVVPVVPIKN